AAIQHHQQAVVLVVGMRRRVHEDPDVREMSQREAERDVTLVLVQRNDAHLSAGKGDERDYEDRKEEEETLHDRILRQDSAKAGGLGWQEGREETQWIEAALALPFLPSCLESDFESELEFPLLVSRRRRELIRVIRNRAGGIAVDVGGHDRVEARHLL